MQIHAHVQIGAACRKMYMLVIAQSDSIKLILTYDTRLVTQIVTQLVRVETWSRTWLVGIFVQIHTR